MSEVKVKFVMDGQEVEAKAGKNVLQAAIDLGVEIPHFCYHPGIGVEGSCRLCLVEVEGLRNLQPSCNVIVKEGMVVKTNTPEVEAARKGVMEFFLLNHPLDCPICDKGGECPLQNYALDTGQGESRMEFEKVHKAKHQKIGEHIMLDKERCVLCNRCVRFMRNLTGREELHFRNRGVVTEIFTPEGQELTTGFTGNLPDICPVGALTSRDFRFQARPWEMKTVNTVCGECSLGCSVQAWTKKLDVLRMTPRVEGGVNEWWLCDRGRFSLGKNLRVPRLIQAKRLHGEEGGIESSKDVIEELKNATDQLSEGSLALVADSGLTNEEFYSLKQMAKATGGKVFVQTRQEVKDIHEALSTQKVEGRFPADLEQADTVLVAGENLEKDHPVLVLRLRRMLAARQIDLVTAGNSEMGFEDLRRGHISVPSDANSIQDFFKKLEKGSHAELKDAKRVYVFLSDQWINQSTVGAIESWIDHTKKGTVNTHVSLLFDAPNIRGILDQWSDHVRPISSLEKEIQQGKVNGLFWLGDLPSDKAFDEYLKGMKLLVHFTPWADSGLKQAHWQVPMDTFLEKKGTYTNSFGRLRVLRRATRVVEKGYQTLEFLSGLASAFSGSHVAELGQLYQSVSRDLPVYPKRLEDIPESFETYAYLERAQWQ